MCVLLILFLSSVPAIDEELVTETSLSLLPEEISKNTDVAEQCMEIKLTETRKEGVCMCLTVYTLAVCKNQFFGGA